MPPTETTILNTLILPLAPLPTILPIPKFTALFPASVRSNPQISRLYRALQHQRTLQTDAVRTNIAAEARRGEAQKRIVARARRDEIRDGAGNGLDGDAQGEWGLEELMDAAMDGGRHSAKLHTLTSIVPEMEAACTDLEAEIRELEEEAEEVLGEMKGTVGALSDLRYGRFVGLADGGEVREEVLEGLRRLRGQGADVGEGG